MMAHAAPSVRLLTAKRDYELRQMDVETAFLNAPMEDEVYMRQPEGYIVDDSQPLEDEPSVYVHEADN